MGRAVITSQSRREAFTVLGGADLDNALEDDGEVEVACFPLEHRWKLNEQDKANLRKNRQAAGAA